MSKPVVVKDLGDLDLAIAQAAAPAPQPVETKVVNQPKPVRQMPVVVSRSDVRRQPFQRVYGGSNELRDSNYPCLGGFAVIINDDRYSRDARRMVRLESLRVRFAFVEPLALQEYDPDIRFGIVGASMAGDRLKIGGPENCLGFWSGLIGSRSLCKKCLHTPLLASELALIGTTYQSCAAAPDKFQGFVKDLGYCNGDGTKRVYSRLKSKGKNRRRCDVCHASTMHMKNGPRQAFADTIVGEGFFYSNKEMSDNSLHLTSQHPLAKCCDKLKYGLLAAQRFDQMILPSALFVTPAPSVAAPSLEKEGVGKLVSAWIDGTFVLSTNLSPIDGTLESIEKHPADGSLMFTIGGNRIMFPPQFESVADIGDEIHAGDIVAEPKRMTRDEFNTLSQSERVTIINLLSDGACVESNPVVSQDGSSKTFDFTYGRKKGIVYYPYGLIRADQVGAVYVDCASIPLGAVQVWDFPIQGKDVTGKLIFKSSVLQESGAGAAVWYDFFNSPRRPLVEAYCKEELNNREAYFAQQKLAQHPQVKPVVDKVPLLSDTVPVQPQEIVSEDNKDQV